MWYAFGLCVSNFFFFRVPLSQYATYTRAGRYCKYQSLLIGYWSSGMFRYLAGLKSSLLPPSESTMLWISQILQVMIFLNLKRLDDNETVPRYALYKGARRGTFC